MSAAGWRGKVEGDNADGGLRSCLDFSTEAILQKFSPLFLRGEGGIVVPTASKPGENRGEKSKKERELRISNNF